MFASCTKHDAPSRTLRVDPMLRVAFMLAVLSTGMTAANVAFAERGLQLASAAGSLISDDAGSKRVTLRLDPASVSEGDQVVATLYRYDDNAKVSPTALDTYRVSPSQAKGGAQVS